MPQASLAIVLCGHHGWASRPTHKVDTGGQKHQHPAACSAGAQAPIQKLQATLIGCKHTQRPVCCAGRPGFKPEAVSPPMWGVSAVQALLAPFTCCCLHRSCCRFGNDAHDLTLPPSAPAKLQDPCRLPAVQAPSQAPIQKLLPPEVMLLIFSQLPIASTARAQCSCRQWYRLGLAPDLWRTACQEAFQRCSYKRNSWLLRREYRCGVGVPCTLRTLAAAPCTPQVW